MKVLIVASYNAGFYLPFITEQANALRDLGVEIDYFGVTARGYWGYLKTRKALLRKIDEYQPDLIHAHYGLCGVLANLQSSVPVITTYHNGEILTRRVRLLCRLSLHRSKYNIFVAQHIYDILKPHPKNYTIMPCGINIDQFVPIEYVQAREVLQYDKNHIYILFGGAYSDLRKNYELLKEAIQYLPFATKVVCVEMKGLNRADCVLRMCGCDLFCLPSKSEGSPQALKEAMACNCPIVATDVADVRYLLGDVEGHYLVTNKHRGAEKWIGDDASAKELAERIIDAVNFGKRTEARQRLCDLGLTNDVVAQKIFAIYQQVLNNK